MAFSAAQRRYTRRVMLLTIAYVALLVPAALLLKLQMISGPLAFLVAILPAIPVCGLFLMMGRYLVEETDEYLRMVQVRLLLGGTGFLLCLMTIWGFLENFGLVRHIPANWWPLAWVLGCALASGAQYLRVRFDHARTGAD